MSDIFEALQKAQREAEGRAAPSGGKQRELAAAEGAPGPAATPTQSPRGKPRRHRSGLLSWWRSGAGRNGRDSALPVLEADQQSVLSEHFRVLRTHIEMAGPGAFMVTSALDQEGKTLCAVNLALALAMGIGAHVLVVDADLRHPSVAPSMGLEGGPGLTECLLGEAAWRDCLRSTGCKNLQVLPAGRRTGQAPELLGSERMQRLVSELKAEFPERHIVFDAPPILLTADPMILARYMDHALLVVRAGVTPRAAVLKAIAELGAESFLGIILNDVTDNVSDYYYYGYGSQYGYAKPDKAGR